MLYPAKALMELMTAEKKLATDSPKWRQRYDRHAQSIKRAIDQMVAQGRDVKTEGVGTYEDAPSPARPPRSLYSPCSRMIQRTGKIPAVARQIVTDHACLTRLLDTDSRSTVEPCAGGKRGTT